MGRVVVVPVRVALVLVRMRASCRGCEQGPVQERRDHRLRRSIGASCDDPDSVMSEEGQRSLSNAAGNHHLSSQLTQPNRKEPGLMLRRFDGFRAQNRASGIVHVEQAEIATASEV